MVNEASTFAALQGTIVCMRFSARVLRRATSRTATCWLLCVAIAALHPALGQTEYRCLVTGEYLDEPCCEVRSPSCEARTPEGRSCCEEVLSESFRPAESVSSASCGCCEIVYRAGAPSPALTVTEPVVKADKKPGLVAVLSPQTHVAHSRSEVRFVLLRSAKSPPKSPPLYLLHESFLL